MGTYMGQTLWLRAGVYHSQQLAETVF